MVRTFLTFLQCNSNASITDLHICKNSITSDSSETLSGSCNCGPEYYCHEICQEGGYSVSTLISWQHFPRSTSSRSRCDDSEDVQKSLSDSKTLSTIKEEKESTKPSSTEYPITKSFSQLNAFHYLEVRHVFQFLNFLLSHLVCNEPHDPVQFLLELLEKCLRYRDSFGEPPQLFTSAHLKSVYNAFDPFERGHLSVSQYAEAMKSLGLEQSITPYNQEPPLNEEDCVDQNNFLFEAERCLAENLKKMLRIPKIWEENRLLWNKKMKKRLANKKAKVMQKERELEEEPGEEDGEETKEDYNYCRCSRGSNVITNFCQCSRAAEIKHEPEQLFLN